MTAEVRAKPNVGLDSSNLAATTKKTECNNAVAAAKTEVGETKLSGEPKRTAFYKVYEQSTDTIPREEIIGFECPADRQILVKQTGASSFDHYVSRTKSGTSC